MSVAIILSKLREEGSAGPRKGNPGAAFLNMQEHSYFCRSLGSIWESPSPDETHHVLERASSGSDTDSTSFSPMFYQMPGESPRAERLRQPIHTQVAAQYGMEPRVPFAAVWVGSLRHTVPSEQVKFAFSAFGKVLRVEGPFQDKASYGVFSRAWAIIDYETPEAAAGACAAFNDNIISAIAHAMPYVQNIVAEGQQLQVKLKQCSQRQNTPAASFPYPAGISA
ncbi:hypothetical protein WJX75_008515 [Coccomyxa subellipsoidea]|uniref:RRM domain-containing protein n=1 Tax=Coccomyxa subellipsoidea TaxID=248742 RepID=A0ABR2YK79_9CHLO